MPGLIIGHTSETAARIWVRGDETSTVCNVRIRLSGEPRPKTYPRLHLAPTTDYTATFWACDLEPGHEYEVLATFSPSGVTTRGRLCTIRTPPAGAPAAFSFILSSCNLSIVSVNDLLARLAAMGGTQLANSSLDLPLLRWRAPRSQWLRRLTKLVLRLGLRLVAGGILKCTEVKQPGPQYIRSPFVKLAAVFESVVLDIPSPEPYEPPFLAVGDRVESSSGGTGVVASFGEIVECGSRTRADRACTSATATRRVRRIVVTHVSGTFAKGDQLFRRVPSQPGCSLGTLTSAKEGLPWFDKPSFFIHAGDQIYYDFPSPSRAPAVDEYRLAYREAWFEDEGLRHTLAHWPHYMTLDDHEIADQFALDFVAPEKRWPQDYLDAASMAYREYAFALSPRDSRETPGRRSPFWYTFEKHAGGSPHRAWFFVLDTRTQRCRRCGRIIDEEQMEHLLAWMSEHRADVKFVVTSVPFVAEINQRVSADRQGWYNARNPEYDGWSSPEFEAQRHRIIEHIATGGIERLVFLTGDMHCCYHATMHIGHGLKKYESIIVHELAGGPVNQLQLARVDDFACTHRSSTRPADGLTGVEYEVRLERFHGEVSAVMHLKVDYVKPRHSLRCAPDVVPEIEWSVIRTLTDPGPQGWVKSCTKEAASSADASGPPVGEAVMTGRISFVNQRTVENLRPWPIDKSPATTW